MPFRPRYTIRQLLLLVTAVALLFGGYRWVKGMVSINPKSERFIIGSVEVPVKWTMIAWGETHVGIHQLHEPLIPPGGGDRRPAAVDVEQELFTMSFDDYFGQRTFCIKVSIFGWRQPEWIGYHLIPSCTGGGTTDGGCSVRFAFAPGEGRLKVRLQQWINSQREAKQTELEFIHDGTSFHAVESPRQGMTEIANTSEWPVPSTRRNGF